MERCFVILTLVFITHYCAYITGEAVSNHHWETILFKDGETTDCHLTWLSKARNSSQKSRDLLLTTATCLLEKPARRRAQPIYLPIPSKFSIFLIQYDAGWQEIDRTEMKVKNILLHPQFNGQMNPDSDQFDIAMVKLETPINLNGQIVDEVKEIPDYWSLSNPNNCWVRGQKEHIYSGKGLRNHTLIDIKQLIKEDATLTAPSLPGTPPISYLVSLGAPLICAEAHITGVHGITVRRQSGLISIEMIVYKYTESLVFISLASHKAWIQNVMDHEIDTLKRPFHRDLYNHPQSKNEEKVEDSTVQHNQLEDLKFTLNDTVANLWYNQFIYRKIQVLDSMIPLTNMRGFTNEPDAYSCAVVCYKWNDGKPCSYSFLKKKCYFWSVPRSRNMKGASRAGITIFPQAA